jgi:hypothetical protein
MLMLLMEINGVDSENCMEHVNKMYGKMYISLNVTADGTYNYLQNLKG